MKPLQIIGLFLSVYFSVFLQTFALQIQDSTIYHTSKFTPELSKKTTKKFQRVKKRIEKSQKKLENKKAGRNRIGRWFRDVLFKLGIVLLFMTLAVIVGLLMGYGTGTAQFVGRFAFGFLFGLLLLGLIVAIADDDGIGKMAWLTGGFLTIIFGVLCPEEFEFLLQIIELLGEF